MNHDEALEVAQLVAELWPNPPMNGVRQAFYARALVVIGAQAAALDAVAALFLDERFQPAPGEVIDRALNVASGALDAWELLHIAAAEVAAGRATTMSWPEPVRQAMAASGARVAAIAGAVNNQRELQRLRDRFLDAYRDTMRAAAAGELRADHKELMG